MRAVGFHVGTSLPQAEPPSRPLPLVLTVSGGRTISMGGIKGASALAAGVAAPTQGQQQHRLMPWPRASRGGLLGILGGCLMLQHRDPELATALLRRVRLSALTPAQLVLAARGAACMGLASSDPAFQRLMRALHPRLEGLPQRRLRALSRVCARVKYHDEVMLQRILELVGKKIKMVQTLKGVANL